VNNLKRLRLALSRVLDINILLGLRDVVQRSRMFGLLGFVFFFCACIIILPIHFLTTMTSPTFISYMGIGKCDLRIDLRQSEHIAERFEDALTVIAQDADVERFAPMITSQFQMLQSNGELEIMMIETGDFSLFPLDYLDGTAPQHDGEIALSLLNARDMAKQVGDFLMLLVNGQEKILTVSGIYQDVTNGGRTAKAVLPFDPETVLWYTVNLDLKSPEKLTEKVHEYAAAFYPARITDLEGYVAQTLGNTIQQLRKVTLAAVVVGLLVAMLMTSLFLNMLIARDASQIAIMKAFGFSLQHIRLQYLTKAITLLVVGIILGTLFSNTFGQRLVSVLWGFMGASNIRFVINPVQAYLLLPLLLMAAVSITTIISIAGIKDTSIIKMIAE
jgi:putative ABC transport system permease protein